MNGKSCLRNMTKYDTEVTSVGNGVRTSIVRGLNSTKTTDGSDI